MIAFNKKDDENFFSFKKSFYNCNSDTFFKLRSKNNSFYITLSKKVISIILLIKISIMDVVILQSIKNEEICKYHENIKYDLVIPVNFNDTKNLVQQRKIFKKFLNFENIIIITTNQTRDLKEKNSFIFIKEDELVSKENLIKFFHKIQIKETNRIGWYLQQFLKMSYSRICDKEYYLLWDSDTIPIKPIKMFDKGIPFFDMKEEHHPPYFITLNRIIPDLHISKYSYISEHMIIKTNYMKNLLDEIESNSFIPGKIFWEKILMSIDKTEINKSGFSEFETYGSYVDTKYPNAYIHRRWLSRRDMTKFFGNLENMNRNDFKWLSKDYYTITFEKWDKFEKKNLEFIKDPKIQKLCRPKRFFKYYKRIIKNYFRLKKISNTFSIKI